MILGSSESVAALDFESLNISAVSTDTSSPHKGDSYLSLQVLKVFLTPVPRKYVSTLLRIIAFSAHGTEEKKVWHSGRATTEAQEAANGSRCNTRRRKPPQAS